jgi:hypothetical protein
MVMKFPKMFQHLVKESFRRHALPLIICFQFTIHLGYKYSVKFAEVLFSLESLISKMNFWVFFEQPWILRVLDQHVLDFIVPFSHHIYNISQYLIK